MIDVQHSLILIAVMSVLTMAIKFLPFIIFPGGKETPAVISYLGKVLPPAMIAMLVVYCLKGVSVFTAPHGLPELIAVAAVVALHLWKRNTLISIIGGTACYMILIQAVF
ncbi:MAG: branched-chain amino acid transporter permease [Firmicutes bacterium]|nr:branched-chain amino acid transporter AzlD [Clostridiales bacterium]MBQ4340718.1 branched-chain amino acid transporter permease [Bacillota bacterium]